MSAFDRDFAEWMADPAFEAPYRAARQRIDDLDRSADEQTHDELHDSLARAEAEPARAEEKNRS